jgi:hypothetical protein
MSTLLTAEQQIRLAVFQRLPSDTHTAESAIAAIEKISAAIIGVAVAPVVPVGGVLYEGFVYKNIPEWAEYIAADSSGYVCFFEKTPYLEGQTWYGRGQCQDVAYADVEAKRYIASRDTAYPVLKLDKPT